MTGVGEGKMLLVFFFLKIFRKYQLTCPELPSTSIEAASGTGVPQRTKHIEYSLKTNTLVF